MYLKTTAATLGAFLPLLAITALGSPIVISNDVTGHHQAQPRPQQPHYNLVGSPKAAPGFAPPHIGVSHAAGDEIAATGHPIVHVGTYAGSSSSNPVHVPRGEDEGEEADGNEETEVDGEEEEAAGEEQEADGEEQADGDEPEVDGEEKQEDVEVTDEPEQEPEPEETDA